MINYYCKEGIIIKKVETFRDKTKLNTSSASLEKLQPGFLSGRLSLDRTTALVPEFVVKDLALGQNTLMMIMMMMMMMMIMTMMILKDL